MKKDNVLQYAVVITGIILGYHFIDSLLVLLITTVSWMLGGGKGDSAYFPDLRDVLFVLAKGTISWLLIMRSGKIAGYIVTKGGIDTRLAIVAKPITLLQILFVTIGIYFLVVNLPYLLNDLLDSFREKHGLEIAGRTPILANRFALIIQTVLAALLIGTAQPLSAYLVKRLDEAPLSIIQNIDSISTDESADTQ